MTKTSPEREEAERKLRIYVNSGANMSRGKYAAQAIHAALLAVGAHPDVPVVVLGANREQIEKLPVQVRDAGRTEVEPGTLTAGTDWVGEAPVATTPAVIAALREVEAWITATGTGTDAQVIQAAIGKLAAGAKTSTDDSPLLVVDATIGPSPFAPNQLVHYIGGDSSERALFAQFKTAMAVGGNSRFTLVNFDDGTDARDIITADLAPSSPCGSCGSSNNNGMACFNCGRTDADG